MINEVLNLGRTLVKGPKNLQKAVNTFASRKERAAKSQLNQMNAANKKQEQIQKANLRKQELAKKEAAKQQDLLARVNAGLNNLDYVKPVLGFSPVDAGAIAKNFKKKQIVNKRRATMKKKKDLGAAFKKQMELNEKARTMKEFGL